MQVTGKLFEIKDTQQLSETFKKRMFILEYIENPQYPEYISFEVVQDRCSLLDNFQPGQTVEVSFNMKGRKWISPDGEAKYFNKLQAWRIEQAMLMPSKPSTAAATPDTESTDNNDLPF